MVPRLSFTPTPRPSPVPRPSTRPCLPSRRRALRRPREGWRPSPRAPCRPAQQLRGADARASAAAPHEEISFKADVGAWDGLGRGKGGPRLARGLLGLGFEAGFSWGRRPWVSVAQQGLRCLVVRSLMSVTRADLTAPHRLVPRDRRSRPDLVALGLARGRHPFDASAPDLAARRQRHCTGDRRDGADAGRGRVLQLPRHPS